MPDIREFDVMWADYATANFSFPDWEDFFFYVDANAAKWLADNGKWKREIPLQRDGLGDPGADPVESWDKPNTQPIIHHLVQADLEQRLAQGIHTYGQPLRANNGRDALQDAYEEALDLACYLKQEMVERASVDPR